jgi:hypothetical protein
MKTPMQHQFSQVPSVTIQRSKFNRSHGHKTTFDIGKLVPFYVDEALPGDTFNLKTTAFVRMSTPIFPIMDNIYLDTHFFAIPLRLVWDNFQRFMGEQDNPDSSTDFLVPTMTSPASTGYAENSLQDYMGIPPGVPDLEHSALFMRAYNLVYNEWYRDQNLVDSLAVNKDDGPDNVANYTLRTRNKRHDYFTSCLPFPQKGDSIDIPIGTQAPITGLGKNSTVYTGTNGVVRETGGTTTTIYAKYSDASGVNNLLLEEDPNNPGFPGIYADLTNATAATINQLRQAFQIQRMLERDARGGTRYVELIKSHFGVVSPDARLQRSEYLGGGSSPLNTTPIPNTADNLGELGAYSTGLIRGHGFTKSFTEHTIILGIVSARADLTYQQGLNRMFSRQTKYDFFWPSLANIGEQAVLNKEIYAQGTTDDDLAFGYQERYAEYRYKPSMVTGRFRSTSAASLDSWHLAQEFVTLPQLNTAFIQETPPINRVLAVTTEPDFIGDFLVSLNCVRPMPMYSVPGLIDHF